MDKRFFLLLSYNSTPFRFLPSIPNRPFSLSLFPHAPYATWPIGLSSSMPGAMKFVRGSPVSLAAEQRAIVGELGRVEFMLATRPQ